MRKAPKAKINKKNTIVSVIERSKAFMSMYSALAPKKSVAISNGNDKLGDVVNVSLPPVLTCNNCQSCVSYCYAIRLYLKYGFDRKDGKLNPWLMNYCIYLADPERYFNEISNNCFNNRYFRWHTSGDIVDYRYFEGMIKVAINNPHCEFLAFTKQYEIVNAYIDNNSLNAIPKNLHLLFSASPNVDMVNPYNLPECHISFEDTILNTFKGCDGIAFECSGNCSECIKGRCGCFNLNNGDVTIINQH